MLLPEMRQKSSLEGKIRPEPEFLIFYEAKESIPPSYSHCLSENTDRARIFAEMVTEHLLRSSWKTC